jgi:hypothetical protein
MNVRTVDGVGSVGVQVSTEAIMLVHELAIHRDHFFLLCETRVFERRQE